MQTKGAETAQSTATKQQSQQQAASLSERLMMTPLDDDDDNDINGNGIAHSPSSAYVTQRKDLWTWYSYDAGSSPYAAVCIGVFAPLLMDALAFLYAYDKAGLVKPAECKSPLNSSELFYPPTGCVKCVPGRGDQLFFSADNYTRLPRVEVSSGMLPSSFALTVISISVFVQAVCFISFGAMADFSNMRKQLLIATSALGAISTMSFVFTPLGTTGSGLFVSVALVILSNLLYGVSTIFYNAFLPYLTFGHKKMHAARQQQQSNNDNDTTNSTNHTEEGFLVHLSETLQNKISSIGFICGYVTSVVTLGIAAVALFAAGAFASDATEVDAMRGYVWACFVCGMWWLVFTPLLFNLHAWPGRSLPPGRTSYIVEGWKETWTTLVEAHKLKHTFRFLILYFVFSDGISTTGSVGLLFAKHDMCAGVVEQFAIAVLVPVSAIFGTWIFFSVQRWLVWKPMRMLRVTLLVYLMLPVWGLIGFIPSSPIGFHQIWELYLVGVWFGLVIGATQSYARTVFADLTPPGMESNYFSLYAITDKGSSWIGPLLVGMLAQVDSGQGTMRISFVYLFVAVAVPCAALGWVDVGEGRAAARNSSGCAPLSPRSARETEAEQIDVEMSPSLSLQ